MLLQAAKEILRADEGTVSYLLGGITVGTAVVGTLGGGEKSFACYVTPWHEPVTAQHELHMKVRT